MKKQGVMRDIYDEDLTIEVERVRKEEELKKELELLMKAEKGRLIAQVDEFERQCLLRKEWE